MQGVRQHVKPEWFQKVAHLQRGRAAIDNHRSARPAERGCRPPSRFLPLPVFPDIFLKRNACQIGATAPFAADEPPPPTHAGDFPVFLEAIEIPPERRLRSLDAQVYLLQGNKTALP